MKTYVNLKECNDVYVLDEFRNKDLVSVDDLLDKISELAAEVESLEDDLKDAQMNYRDLEEDIEENYIHRPMSHYTGDRYDDRF